MNVKWDFDVEANMIYPVLGLVLVNSKSKTLRIALPENK